MCAIVLVCVYCETLLPTVQLQHHQYRVCLEGLTQFTCSRFSNLITCQPASHIMCRCACRVSFVPCCSRSSSSTVRVAFEQSASPSPRAPSSRILLAVSHIMCAIGCLSLFRCACCSPYSFSTVRVVFILSASPKAPAPLLPILLPTSHIVSSTGCLSFSLAVLAAHSPGSVLTVLC